MTEKSMVETIEEALKSRNDIYFGCKEEEKNVWGHEKESPVADCNPNPPRVYVLNRKYVSNLDKKREGLEVCHTKLWIAPEQPSRTLEDLSNFTESIQIPGMEPTLVVWPGEDYTVMHFGEVYFDELVGALKVEENVDITDTHLAQQLGYPKGSTNRIRELPLWHTCGIFVLPSKSLVDYKMRSGRMYPNFMGKKYLAEECGMIFEGTNKGK